MPISPASSGVGGLSRWKRKLANSPSTAKIVMIGDSTTDGTTAPSLLNRLKYLHTARDEALAGMATANIISQGNNGMALSVYLGAGGGTYAYADLVAAAPDLVIASWGINDMRLGATTQTQMRDRLATLIESIRTDIPGADILLRIPNPYLSADVGAHGYVSPNSSAQAYSDQLRAAHLELRDRWSNVDILDVPADLWGTTSLATHPLAVDQLHPSNTTSSSGNVPNNGGYVAIADLIAQRIGTRPTFAPHRDQSYRFRREGIVISGAANACEVGRLSAETDHGAQWPVVAADALYVEGVAGPLSLASAAITRPFANNVYISSLPASGFDFSTVVGARVVIVGDHPDATTGDRQQVTINPGSITAGSYLDVTGIAVTGVKPGDYTYAQGIVVDPPSDLPAGILFNAFPSGTDTVTLRLFNATGGAVDPPSSKWSFWVIR